MSRAVPHSAFTKQRMFAIVCKTETSSPVTNVPRRGTWWPAPETEVL